MENQKRIDFTKVKSMQFSADGWGNNIKIVLATEDEHVTSTYYFTHKKLINLIAGDLK